MKKRVAVYCERLAHVLRVIRALPLFSFHRQDWDVLRPFTVRFIELEAGCLLVRTVCPLCVSLCSSTGLTWVISCAVDYE